VVKVSEKDKKIKDNITFLHWNDVQLEQLMQDQKAMEYQKKKKKKKEKFDN
jgi:hypothetical protein